MTKPDAAARVPTLDAGVSPVERSVLRAVGREAAALGVRVHLVGGAVRDTLLSRSTKDLDVAVESRTEKGESVSTLARSLCSHAGFTERSLHPRFGTAVLETSGFRVDLAATRREVYAHPAALPRVTTGASMDEDLRRRDFTIHAMAREIEPEGSLGPLRDPLGGRRDLEAGILRLLHDRSLVDDPTRAFRAARYAARLGFEASADFGAAVAVAKREGAFQALTGDRFRRALSEVLAEADPERGLRLLSAFELFAEIDEAWREGSPRVEVVSSAPRRERWRALLEPLAPAARERVAERLRFSKALRREAGLAKR